MAEGDYALLLKFAEAFDPGFHLQYEKLIEVLEALIKLQRLNINDMRESVGFNGVKGVNSRRSPWSCCRTRAEAHTSTEEANA